MSNKKNLKDLKKRIVNESAINVGYSVAVVQKLPTYAVIEAIKTISSNGWVKNDTNDAEITNMLVSEAVKETNFQDFKEIAPYFFGYEKEN